MDRYHFSRQELALYEGLQTPFAIFQLVRKRVVTLALSDGFCELLGIKDRAEAYAAMDHDTFTNVHPDDAARVGNAVTRFMREEGKFDCIYRLKRGEAYRILHASGKHVYTESGVRLAHVWYTDEGEYLEGNAQRSLELNSILTNALHEESILKANYYDELTGLPNLTYFFDLAEAWKESLMQQGEYAALLYIDLNGMKYYNHKYGYGEGDKLLLSFAELLIATFGANNCGHISADRFAVFTTDTAVAEILPALFRKAKDLNAGKSLPVHVGVYSSRTEDVPVSIAYDRAKVACDALGKKYDSCYNLYDQKMRDAVRMRQYVQGNIDRAIAEKWIQVYYQPIIRTINEKVCDVEALARWIDPVEGFLSPADFIPYLEDCGLIHKLDLYVLEQVLEKIRLQQEEGLYIVPHSVNLSRSDFTACDIVEEIRRRVDEAGVSRDRITIEITESIIGSDFEFMKQQVERFEALGFPVWMDDFGSGYSSLDVLQSIKFNLVKFDMGFMRKLDEGEKGRIILTELIKMTTSLGLDTVCEGVETQEQVRFLREIGCSKLQGYYFSKPVPLSILQQRHEQGLQIEHENPEESGYYEAIGRVNLYDLGVIANNEEGALHNAFSMVPMGILEVRGEYARFSRSNRSYREFIKRFFHLDLSQEGSTFAKYSDGFTQNVVKTCCERGIRSFYDEKMPDGTIVHSFARRIGVNPVTGTCAVAVAVLSITDPDEETSYAEIARALAADYYNIYIVDLDTEDYIEYTSPVGGQELAVERHGKNFFQECLEAAPRIYAEDRETFFSVFTKENITQTLNQHGVFTATYRLVDFGEPVYVSMKATRLPDSNRFIAGISIVDSLMKQQAHLEELHRERDTLVRIMALSDGYLSLFTIDPKTDHYIEYSSTEDFDSLGTAKEGESFFRQAAIDARIVLCPDDVEMFISQFQKERVLAEIQEQGSYKINYRLMLNGVPVPVTLKIAQFHENGEEKLVAGVRKWKKRR